jgi:hypothetical protein
MQVPSPPSQRWQPTKAASCVVLSAAVEWKFTAARRRQHKEEKLFSLAHETQRVGELIQFILNFCFFPPQFCFVVNRRDAAMTVMRAITADPPGEGKIRRKHACFGRTTIFRLGNQSHVLI